VQAIVFASGIAGCGQRQADPPSPQSEAPEAPATATEAPAPAAPRATVDEAFLAHMHEHAEKLDDINFALADDDLAAAMSPAYWLSRHDTVSGIPADWVPFVEGMRTAATDVENATDLEGARAAAARITENCQGCHVAAGATLQ
jgi:hypothetical protein